MKFPGMDSCWDGRCRVVSFGRFANVRTTLVSYSSSVHVLGCSDFCALSTEPFFQIYFLYDKLSTMLVEPCQMLLSMLWETARHSNTSKTALEFTLIVLNTNYLPFFTLSVKLVISQYINN